MKNFSKKLSSTPGKQKELKWLFELFLVIVSPFVVTFLLSRLCLCNDS